MLRMLVVGIILLLLVVDFILPIVVVAAHGVLLILLLLLIRIRLLVLKRSCYAHIAWLVGIVVDGRRVTLILPHLLLL